MLSNGMYLSVLTFLLTTIYLLWKRKITLQRKCYGGLSCMNFVFPATCIAFAQLKYVVTSIIVVRVRIEIKELLLASVNYVYEI